MLAKTIVVDAIYLSLSLGPEMRAAFNELARSGTVVVRRRNSKESADSFETVGSTCRVIREQCGVITPKSPSNPTRTQDRASLQD